MRSVTAERRRLALLGACLLALVFAIGAVTLGESDARPAATPVGVRPVSIAPTTTSVPPGFSADTVQVDAIDGDSLAVHSIRHPELHPYTVDIDKDTIFMASGGLLAPTPGMHVASRFYFTGVEQTAEPTPYRVRALRVFYDG